MPARPGAILSLFLGLPFAAAAQDADPFVVVPDAGTWRVSDPEGRTVYGAGGQAM